MSIQTQKQRVEDLAQKLPPGIRSRIIGLHSDVRDELAEIRLRIGQPLALYMKGKQLFMRTDGSLTSGAENGCYIVTQTELILCVRSLCDYSLHTHEQEIREGFISIPGGHRAGICGTAVRTDKSILTVRDISSVNIRISRQSPGCADSLITGILKNSLCGLLIAGPPGSGKTTLLRDLARQLSSGKTGIYYRVAVLDERGEIGGCHNGIPQNDLGPGCDLLNGYPKGEGILGALRSLSPDVVICDEIGSPEEIGAVTAGINSGVTFLTSIHAASSEELVRRPQGVALLRTGAFHKLILLEGAQTPCRIKSMVNVYDLLDTFSGSGMPDLQRVAGGRHSVGQTVAART
jgi:stage III sporulation protein AA